MREKTFSKSFSAASNPKKGRFYGKIVLQMGIFCTSKGQKPDF
jgi:hypothetical protein